MTERHEIHVTVISFPDEGLSVSKDIELVKSALLYADRVTLVSPKSAFLALMGGLASLPSDAMAAVVEDLGIRMAADSALSDRVTAIRRKRRKTVDDLLLLRRLDEEMARAARQLQDRAAEQVVESGGNELAAAVNAGVLDVESLGLESDGNTEAVTARFVTHLLASVGPDATTFPMLDDQAGNMLRAYEREQGLPSRYGKEAEEVGLAGYLIGGLESFPDAPMSEVLDARRDLVDPLVGFRSAIGNLALTMSSAPWDPGFRTEAESIYRREVAPRLLELQQQTRKMDLRSSVARGLASWDPAVGVAAGITIVAAVQQAVPSLIALGGAVGLGTMVQSVVSEIYRDRRDLAAAKDANKMVFLFEADRRLARGR